VAGEADTGNLRARTDAHDGDAVRGAGIALGRILQQEIRFRVREGLPGVMAGLGPVLMPASCRGCLGGEECVGGDNQGGAAAPGFPATVLAGAGLVLTAGLRFRPRRADGPE